MLQNTPTALFDPIFCTKANAGHYTKELLGVLQQQQAVPVLMARASLQLKEPSVPQQCRNQLVCKKTNHSLGIFSFTVCNWFKSWRKSDLIRIYTRED